MQPGTATVTERFAQVEPGNFADELERIWTATDRIKDCVSEQVQQGNISPLDGLAMVASIVGHAFGYQQANGQPTQRDFLRSLHPESAVR